MFDHVAQNRAVERTLLERRASCILKVEIHHGYAALCRREKRLAVYVNSDHALTMFPTERRGKAACIATDIQNRRRTSARDIGDGIIPRTKNGPALAGYGAVTMKNALATTMTTLPEQLRRSLTWDRGKELSAHAAFTVETDIPVYFADPKSPWQRGTNENTNGLLRQYFPKGTDLSRWSAEEIEAVAATINNRPRKILDWKTPAEALDQRLRSLQQAGVATTD